MHQTCVGCLFKEAYANPPTHFWKGPLGHRANTWEGVTVWGMPFLGTQQIHIPTGIPPTAF